MDLTARLRWLRRLGVACVAMTVLIMASGAWVKANSAGLSCPDWPKCYGEWMPPFPSMESDGSTAGIQGPAEDHAEGYTQAQVLYEWGHRTIVALTGPVVIAFAALSFRRQELSFPLQRLPLAALLLMVAQATLGAITVRTGNPAWATSLHLLTATAFLLLLAFATSFAYLRPVPVLPPAPPPKPDSLVTVPPERRIDFVYQEGQAAGAEPAQTATQVVAPNGR